MTVNNVSFFTLEGAVCRARSLSEADPATYVVAKLLEESRDPASGPWSVLNIEQGGGGTSGHAPCAPAEWSRCLPRLVRFTPASRGWDAWGAQLVTVRATSLFQADEIVVSGPMWPWLVGQARAARLVID